MYNVSFIEVLDVLVKCPQPKPEQLAQNDPFNSFVRYAEGGLLQDHHDHWLSKGTGNMVLRVVSRGLVSINQHFPDGIAADTERAVRNERIIFTPIIDALGMSALLRSVDNEVDVALDFTDIPPADQWNGELFDVADPFTTSLHLHRNVLFSMGIGLDDPSGGWYEARGAGVFARLQHPPSPSSEALAERPDINLADFYDTHASITAHLAAHPPG